MNLLEKMDHKIIVAITGASGSIYAKLFLDKLVELKDQIHSVGIVMSSNAKEVWEHELENKEFENYPFTLYEKSDFMAPFASGSALYNKMVIIPSSMGTMGRIANGISNDLITRAADVILKERRQLIICARETPLNLIHIENMRTITLAGGIIVPAIPSFYSKPQTIEAVANTVVLRIIDLMGLNNTTYRWGSSNEQ